MQRFTVFLKNKIFVSLTIILIIAIFFTIRECDYPLLFHTKFAKLIFVHKYTEKLFYNLSLSYIAAYVFYVIQIFIPQTIMNRKAYHILISNFQQEYRSTKEFLFLVKQFIKTTEDFQIQYKSITSPIYYKESYYNNIILKRFSDINTLEQLVTYIRQQFTDIENSKYYDELDSYIVGFHSLFPISEIQKCLNCIKYSFDSISNLNVISNDLITPIDQFLHQMAHILPKCTEVAMSQCTDYSLISKYENAVKASGLDEVTFALSIKESRDDTRHTEQSSPFLTDSLI